MAKNVPLSEALTTYERHLRARGLAANTVVNHTQTIRRGIALWGDIQVSSITGAHIDSLFTHYGWAESTRNLYLSYLRAFFTWARRGRLMAREFDPTDGWRSVKVPKVDRFRVPLEEFNDLLDAAPHPRDRMVCAIGLFTFLRGSEIMLLRVSDVDLDANSLKVYRPKVKEGDVLPISTELHAELVRWFNWYREDQGVVHQDWYLTPAKWPAKTGYDRETGRIFVTDEPAHLKPEVPIHRPYLAVQRAMAELGYETHWQGEHTLRRSGARAMADTLRDMGYDGALLRVASMLGHSDVRITQKYIGWELEKELRNHAIAGKPMFPSMGSKVATVTDISRKA
jgi:integrase